jgi:ATP-binding cassette subfamily F protein 3
MRQLDIELEEARINAVRIRARDGAFMGSIDAPPFVLPNPGGGTNLLDQASFTLVRGHRYGLIGRNGKGKSTLLRSLAARHVGAIPAAVTMHYVSQEVQMTEEQGELTAVDVVLRADVQRRLLMEELEDLQALLAQVGWVGR